MNRSRFSVSPLQKKHQTISVNNLHWSKNQVIKEKQKVKKRKQKFLQNPEKKKKSKKERNRENLAELCKSSFNSTSLLSRSNWFDAVHYFFAATYWTKFYNNPTVKRSQRKPDLTIASKEEEISSKDGCWGEEPMVNTNGSRVWMGVWLGRCERKGFGTMMPLGKEREKWAFIVGPNTSSTIGPSNEYFNGFFFFTLIIRN